MPADQAAESRFLEELPTLRAIVGVLCRRRGLVGADAEDFTGHVYARFVESGYAPIVEFREESSLKTYLTVVVTRWLNDYVVARDGRWRPSAVASRLGPVAVLLERLISKGSSIDEAVASVLLSHDQPFNERELRAMARQLPRRVALRPKIVSADGALDFVESTATGADGDVETSERETAAAEAQQALSTAMQSLSAEDRTVVSMRFLDGASVADIARALRLDAKPLYRRLERAIASLRKTLEQSGLTAQRVRDLVGGSE